MTISNCFNKVLLLECLHWFRFLCFFINNQIIWYEKQNIFILQRAESSFSYKSSDNFKSIDHFQCYLWSLYRFMFIIVYVLGWSLGTKNYEDAPLNGSELGEIKCPNFFQICIPNLISLRRLYQKSAIYPTLDTEYRPCYSNFLSK